MLYVRFTTEALIEEVRSLRRRTGWPERTDGPWALLDRLERAERELRIRGIDPERVETEPA